jgi:hypothetical protein
MFAAVHESGYGPFRPFRGSAAICPQSGGKADMLRTSLNRSIECLRHGVLLVWVPLNSLSLVGAGARPDHSISGSRT